MHAQVILKPDPGRPQELYLGSLAALGIDTSAHDIRFVEDNWENPTLGAWGLGWEVWLDGERWPRASPAMSCCYPLTPCQDFALINLRTCLQCLHAAALSFPPSQPPERGSGCWPQMLHGPKERSFPPRPLKQGSG